MIRLAVPGRGWGGVAEAEAEFSKSVKTQYNQRSVARRKGDPGRATQRVMHPSEGSSKSSASKTGKDTEAAAMAAAMEGDGSERAGNVDKIRDILFGSQMRDYDRRFARFEERLVKDASELREDVKRRFESMESFVRGELESLGDRLKKEQAERTESLKELTREVREAVKSWEKRAAQMEEQSTKSFRDLRQQVLEESKRLGDQIEAKAKDGAEALDKEIRELGDRTQDRFELADLLTELGLRLKNEFEMPERK